MNGRSEKRTDCENCPLRTLDHFRAFTSDELAYVSRFKVGEFAVDAGATILMEGAQSAHLFTVLSGWGFRYKTLDDGRRQILNYVMPGDLVGLQGSLLGEMQHSIEALSPVTLCVFERTKLNELYKSYPELAYDLTWIAAREERILDENLLSIGRRSALERAAYLLAFLYQRAEALNLFDGNRVAIPITQQHVADTLGLSIVHTNKTLKKLAARGVIRWAEKGCNVGDIKGLLAIAGWDGYREIKRPFI
ncbi:Crp/Fnr family transcriptional regulator [Ensifer sp. 2YAB10]|jgi:CRP-like cAMP-binding protein|uniref:Crp/Fnr family transcriptional regulator n=1 Tax=unclassified Ensifer TaxID=2633371 RepID=UPI0013B00DED|nr:Crp/Fnr family transcriptional regulator [Ensifer sp. SSB1]MBK5569658.1 Crp/Fnr family transcriptional regulator [Ensifer sp. SSB1]